MKDYQASLEKLRAHAADAALIRDLATDPAETRNLFDPADPEHARMAEELARYKQKLVDGFDPAHASGLSDEETYERLKALGYAR